MTDVYAPQSPTDSREFVKSFLADGTTVFDRVNFEDLDFSRIFGQVTTSTTQNTISYGIKGFTLDVDDGSIQVNYPLQMRSLDDPDCFQQGVVVLKDTRYSPAYIEVAVTIISPLVNTTNNWELSVIPLAGFSINPGATVGISTSSIDASGDGPFTFTTQTDKLFMQSSALGGTVVCTALSDPKTYLFARVAAITGTSLVVNKIYSNATTSIDAWSIQLFDGPDLGLPRRQITGLLVERSGTNYTFQPGSIRSYSGNVQLNLDTALVKSIASTWAAGTGNGGVITTALTGTITSAGTAVTGSGTLFGTEVTPSDFSDPYNLDYNEQTQSDSTNGIDTIIAAAGKTASVPDTLSDTSLTSSIDLGASASSYTRNGVVTVTPGTSNYLTYFAVIFRRDSDGVIDAGFVSSTPTGEPDLPSGYTEYRVVAALFYNESAGAWTIEIYQPLYADLYPFAAQDQQYLLWGTGGAGHNEKFATQSTSITIDTASPGVVSFTRAALTGDVTASANSNATTIALDAVTNLKLNNMAAYTLKGRNAGTTGDPSDIDISALTEKTTLADDDLFLIQDSAASNAFKKAKKSNVSTGGGGASFPADMGLITEAATTTFDCGTVP